MARIADYKDILARRERQIGIIKDDLGDLSSKFGDGRRSQIVEAVGDFDMEDLIEDEDCVVTITNSGYIKRLPVDTYRTQKRGGKGVIGGKLKNDEDYIAQVYLASNHQYLLVFTTEGKLYWLKVYEVPQGSRTSRGKALANVLDLPEGEEITTVLPVREFPDDKYITIATIEGVIKKTVMSAIAVRARAVSAASTCPRTIVSSTSSSRRAKTNSSSRRATARPVASRNPIAARWAAPWPVCAA